MTRALILAATLGLGLGAMPTAARADRAVPTAISETEPAPTPGPADSDRYAEREQQAPQLEDFNGGHRTVLAISGGTLLVIILLVLILA